MSRSLAMLRKNSTSNGCRNLTLAGAFTIGLMASMAHAAVPAPAPADRTPPLARETWAQFDLAYKMHPNERELRHEQLAAAVNAWRAAPRTDANYERLNNWLRAAIRSSMPGSREALPPLPIFAATTEPRTQSAASVKQASANTPLVTTASKSTPAKAPVVAPATPTKSASTPHHKPDADPFRDDPADAQ